MVCAGSHSRHDLANVGMNFSFASANGSLAPSIKDMPVIRENRLLWRIWLLHFAEIQRLTCEEHDIEGWCHQKLIQENFLRDDFHGSAHVFIIQPLVPGIQIRWVYTCSHYGISANSFFVNSNRFLNLTVGITQNERKLWWFESLILILPKLFSLKVVE